MSVVVPQGWGVGVCGDPAWVVCVCGGTAISDER